MVMLPLPVMVEHALPDYVGIPQVGPEGLQAQALHP